MKKLARILEVALLSSIGAIFVAPGGLLLVAKYAPFHDRVIKCFQRAWICEEHANTNEKHVPPIPFSWHSLASSRWQGGVGGHFDKVFAGRKLLIRTTNDCYYRLLDLCPMPSAAVLVGKGGWLFEDFYVEEYCRRRGGEADVARWVTDFEELCQLFHQQGRRLVLLVSPSKAAIFPERLPSGWARHVDPRPRAYQYLIERLSKSSIPFVDGHALILAHKADAPASIFPKGGTHWGKYGAWVVSNALLARLGETGLMVNPLELISCHVSNEPEGEDRDLAALLNTASRLRYPVTKLTIQPGSGKENAKPTMALIGGSFSWQLMRQIGASRQFAEIDFFYYFKDGKHAYWNGELHTVREPIGALDFDSEITAADCIVVELNEQDAQRPTHVVAFLKVALNSWRHRTGPLPAFRYESHIP